MRKVMYTAAAMAWPHDRGSPTGRRLAYQTIPAVIAMARRSDPVKPTLAKALATVQMITQTAGSPDLASILVTPPRERDHKRFGRLRDSSDSPADGLARRPRAPHNPPLP